MANPALFHFRNNRTWSFYATTRDWAEEQHTGQIRRDRDALQISVPVNPKRARPCGILAPSTPGGPLRRPVGPAGMQCFADFPAWGIQPHRRFGLAGNHDATTNWSDSNLQTTANRSPNLKVDG